MSGYRPDIYRSQKGFTLVELIVTFMIIAILATMGAMYMADMRNRASDSQAFNEGRNLLTALNDAFLAGEDVSFGDGSEVTGAIGSKTTGNEDRPAIFNLSSDVRAILVGDNTSAPGDGEVEVRIWSVNGTPDDSPDIVNSMGKKEYVYLLSEITGEVSTPSF